MGKQKKTRVLSTPGRVMGTNPISLKILRLARSVLEDQGNLWP